MARFLILPFEVLRRKDLSSASKILFACLRFYQGQRGYCWPTTETLAAEIGLSKQQVLRAIKQLEAAGLLTVKRRHRRSSIYSLKKIHSENFLRIPATVLGAGMSAAEALLYSYLVFRTGQNEQCWPHQATVAKDLGLSRPTVSKLCQQLEAAGHLQVKHANGGLKQGNRYRPTERAFCVAKVDTKRESRVKKHTPIDNTLLDLKTNDNHKIFCKKGLSEENRLKTAMLTGEGIHPDVAKSLAEQHALDSIQAACENSWTRAELARKQGRLFRRRAYIVGSLNRARREQHGVLPNAETLRVRQLRARIKGSPKTVLQAQKTQHREQLLDEVRQRWASLDQGKDVKCNVDSRLRKFLGVA